MKYTEKLGLKKPELTDYVNIEDINDNMDVLDEEVGNLKEGSTTIEELQTSNKTLAGAINELKDEVDSKETPSGAQQKANAALNAAKEYTDEEVEKLANDLDAHKTDNTPHREAVSIERKNPDDDGVFTLIEFRRSDGTLFKTSQLNGISPYTSRTVKYYDKNGNLMQTVEYSITYSNDEVVSEVIISA